MLLSHSKNHYSLLISWEKPVKLGNLFDWISNQQIFTFFNFRILIDRYGTYFKDLKPPRLIDLCNNK